MRIKDTIRNRETQSIDEYMFRYLEKYHGKFRVLSDYDLQTLDWPRDSSGRIDDEFEDLYIPCKKGIIRHTYNDYDQLALCFYDKNESISKKIYDEIKATCKGAKVLYEKLGRDQFIYFYDKDIDEIAKVIKPRVSGARIKWHAKSNQKLFKKKKNK